MTRGVAHPQELRAEVINAVLAGATITETATQFNLDKGLVSRWVAAGLQTVATAKKQNPMLEALIVDYLLTGLRAMIVQAEVFADERYCRAQDADKLAIAHGIVADKLTGLAATAQALGIVGLPDPNDDDQTELAAIGAPESA